MGPYKGAQAGLLRVPFADFNCTKLPGSPGDQWEDYFVMLADVFPTGFFATMLAMVMPGLPVAVFGAGPVETDYFEGRHRISGLRAYDFLMKELG